MELREHVGKKLENHRVLEGGCYHKGCYFMIFGNMKYKTSVIVKFKAGREKRVLKVSDVLRIGHGNDCCVRDGVLYITHSGKSNAIHRVDVDSLKKLPDVTVTGCRGGVNGICCMGEGYLVKKMSSSKVFVLDSRFRYLSTITLSAVMKVGQGMTWYKGKLYRASSQGQSKKNYVCVYDSKGKLLKKLHYNHICEIEDVMIVNGVIKVSIYRKRGKQRKKHEAFIRKLK